jgi:hypothetical protein
MKIRAPLTDFHGCNQTPRIREPSGRTRTRARPSAGSQDRPRAS